ncbi:hypothetical protein LOD99_10468 [Oopsacas minuta]|uniref:BED-type domain-containing protein n=1 Tax=Oopsacas minuta TaxID=111878 RepID=A0AAV7KFZ3_9METZ|nr:hypothetical protein LOD99_10468 [Oopsacas minuta]
MTNEEINIEAGLQRGEYHLVQSLNTSVIWKDDLPMIAINDEEVLQGWCTCRHCNKVFKTHSAPDGRGHRRNYGISSMQRHMKTCVKHPTTQSQHPTISNFVTAKEGLSKGLAENLKLAETKFVISGMHSFLSVEEDGLLDLVQTCIKIGNEVGNIDVKTIWYGRKTIRERTIDENENSATKCRKL